MKKKTAKKAAKKAAQMKRCGTCAFYVGTPPGQGIPIGKCHRFPPPHVNTSEVNWCGEYKPTTSRGGNSNSGTRTNRQDHE